MFPREAGILPDRKVGVSGNTGDVGNDCVVMQLNTGREGDVSVDVLEGRGNDQD